MSNACVFTLGIRCGDQEESMLDSAKTEAYIYMYSLKMRQVNVIGESFSISQTFIFHCNLCLHGPVHTVIGHQFLILAFLCLRRTFLSLL